MLNITAVSPLLHPKNGGPATVLLDHYRIINSISKMRVIGLCEKEEEGEILKSFPDAVLCKPSFPKRWAFSKQLLPLLEKEAQLSDCLHAHMLWDYTTYLVSKVSLEKRKPYFITLHGSLNGAWRFNSLYKKVYNILVLKKIFKSCEGIQALNNAEASNLKNFGVPCPIYVIPNGLAKDEYMHQMDHEEALKYWPEFSGAKIALYLGRLWGGKGLDILPEAWLQAGINESYQLVIAGPDHRGYRHNIEMRLKKLGANNKVLLVGPVYGKPKRALLKLADFLIQPSHGEGFSMTILEAMAAKLPCLYTTAC